MIVLAAVVAMFAIFAGALAWAQLYTRHFTRIPASASAGTRPKRRPF